MVGVLCWVLFSLGVFYAGARLGSERRAKVLGEEIDCLRRELGDERRTSHAMAFELREANVERHHELKAWNAKVERG